MTISTTTVLGILASHLLHGAPPMVQERGQTKTMIKEASPKPTA